MGERLILLLPLQGVGIGNMAPRALPWATDLLGFQPAQGRRQGFFRTISPPLNISILNTLMHCLVCIERGALRPTVYQYTSTQAANRLALSRNWLRSASSGALHTTTPMRRLTRVVGLPKMRTSASSSHVSSSPL